MVIGTLLQIPRKITISFAYIQVRVGGVHICENDVQIYYF